MKSTTPKLITIEEAWRSGAGCFGKLERLPQTVIEGVGKNDLTAFVELRAAVADYRGVLRQYDAANVSVELERLRAARRQDPSKPYAPAREQIEHDYSDRRAKAALDLESNWRDRGGRLVAAMATTAHKAFSNELEALVGHLEGELTPFGIALSYEAIAPLLATRCRLSAIARDCVTGWPDGLLEASDELAKLLGIERGEA